MKLNFLCIFLEVGRTQLLVSINLRIKMNATQPLLVGSLSQKQRNSAEFELVGDLSFKIHESRKIVSPVLNKQNLNFGVRWGLD